MLRSILLAVLLLGCVEQREGPALPPRAESRRCLASVALEDGPAIAMPARLSETGCFESFPELSPAEDLVPFGVTAELWTDGASKTRYVVVPPGETIGVVDGSLVFPVGTTLIKLFAFELTDDPISGVRPIEVRFSIRGELDWGFFTYRVDDDGQDGVLLEDGLMQTISVSTANVPSELEYRYPGRAECVYCHSDAAGRVLGPSIAQWNTVFDYDRFLSNQLSAMGSIGLIEGLPEDLATLPTRVSPHDASAPLEDRARAYLDINCSHCHQPGGFSSPDLILDMREELALEDTGLCDPVQFARRLGDQRVAPGDPDTSVIVIRMRDVGFERMPSLGTRAVDTAGVGVIERWIGSMASCP